MKNKIYSCFNKNNELFLIKFHKSKLKTISLIFIYKNIHMWVTLSIGFLNYYKFIDKFENIIKTKIRSNISTHETINKKEYNTIRYYPVYLQYHLGQFQIVVDTTKDKFNEFLIFNIDDIDTLLEYLKNDCVFPGDKFIGLEVIKLTNKAINHNYLWKAKCLLCGREIIIRNNSIKIRKSCGCLNGSCFDSDEERFLSHVDKQEGIPEDQQIRGTLTDMSLGPCHLFIGCKDKDGYGRIRIKRADTRAHRYSLEQKLKRKLLTTELACHRCDNPSCVNPDHLFEGTVQDNANDMINKGRSLSLYGEKNHNSKLLNNEVIKIRKMLSDGIKQVEIAKKYKISTATVCNIKKKKTWYNENNE